MAARASVVTGLEDFFVLVHPVSDWRLTAKSASVSSVIELENIFILFQRRKACFQTHHYKSDVMYTQFPF